MPVMNHKLLFGLCKMADDHVIVVMNAFELYVFLEIHTAVAEPFINRLFGAPKQSRDPDICRE